jgi:peptidyl-dipeptidase A
MESHMTLSRFLFALVLVLGGWTLFAVPVVGSEKVTEQARRFVAEHEKRIRPLDIAANLAWWQANITGSEEDFKKKSEAENRINAVLANRQTFARLKALKEQSKQIDDPITARAIDVLYLRYLEKQVDPDLLEKMVDRANAVEAAFNVFRPTVDGKKLTDNEMRHILKTATNSDRLKAVWAAGKEVGAVVEKDLKELVQLRNQAAAQLGFKNYHALQLYLNEQDGEQLIKLFDELDDLTREPFRAAKRDIDARLAKRYHIAEKDLRPWHYHDPFFQTTPDVFDVDLDAPFAHTDILKLCATFYRGIGLPIDEVIPRSSLYEKPGKSPHAFCTDIDRAGDVRVLANIKPNNQWTATLLHEFGHSVYSSKNIPATLPYPLRLESHILTTEGVAMQFERLANRGAFLTALGVKLEHPKAYDEAAARSLRYQLLIFSRWCQVMLRFEKSMYENPNQDLNKLWWDLVEKYQEVKRPEGRDAPDYASKIHIVSAPVYYHNYMMGELFASQVHHAIARELYKGTPADDVIYVNNKAVGAFMKKRVFEPGRTLSWNELTKYATGKPLNAKAFAADFQGK